MNKRWALGAIALLVLLVGSIALLTLTRSSDELPSGRSEDEATPTGNPSPTSHSTTAQHHRTTAPARSGELGGSAGSPVEDNDNPPELKIEPIKRAFVQREDDSGPRAKDAPPPLFRKETIQALRTALTPAVKRCIAESLQRNPEYRTIDNPVVINVIYSAGAAGGTVTVHKADAMIQGTQDDEVLKCVETAASAVKVNGGATQSDGDGRFQLVFDYK